MKKILLAGACIIFLSTFCACDSNSTDNTPMNFNGTWNFTMKLVSDPQGWWTADTGHALNSSWSHNIIIVVSGSTITLYDQSESQFTYTGTCDPVAKTFTASYSIGTVALTYTGHAESSSKMSGEFNGSHGADASYPSGKTTGQTWTAELVSR